MSIFNPINLHKGKTMLKRTIIFSSLFIIIASLSNADVPQLINYQGWLTDGNGNPVSATVSIQFKIYDSENAGNVLWSETQTVDATNGIFSVLLGTITPIPYSVFNGDNRYLALQVGNDSEMVPRKRLVSVGYSFRANDSDNLNGIDGSLFIRMMDGVSPGGNGNIDLVAGSNIIIAADDLNNRITISTSTGAGGDDLGNHTATENIKLNGKWLSGDGDDEGISIQNNGNVSIGTSNPDLIYRLQVIGSNSGVKSETSSGTAIRGVSSSGTGVYGQSNGGGPGVWGISKDSNIPGVAGGNTSGRAVSGVSVSGTGVYGESANGFGGWFAGPENNGVDATLKIVSGAETLLLDGNAIDGLNGLFLNNNTDKNVIISTGGGSVGIGTANPATKLEIDGGNTTDGLRVAWGSQYHNLYGEFKHAGPGGLIINANAGGGWADISLQTDKTTRVFIERAGNVGIGTTSPSYKLHVNGSVAGVGAYNNISDVRYKKNIGTISDATEKVRKIRGVQFDWRKDEFSEQNFDEGRQIGFIAQEVKDILPEVVSQDDKGYYSVAYSHIVPVLVEAIKEQQEEIELLKSQTDRLITSLQKLEKLLAAQENAVKVEADKTKMLVNKK